MLMSRRILAIVAGLCLALALGPPASAEPYVDPPKGAAMSHTTTPYVRVTFRAGIAEDVIRATIHDVSGRVLRYSARQATVIAVFPELSFAGPIRQQMILRNIERQPGVVSVAPLQNIRKVLYVEQESRAATHAADAAPQLDGGILEWALATGRKNSRAHFYVTHPNL
jgi:hypothetical protein